MALAVSACLSGRSASPAPEPAEPHGLQDLVLADGQVTKAEYERLVLAEVECVRSAGFVVFGPEWTSGDRYFVYSLSDPSDSGDLSQADACTREFSERALVVYFEQVRQTIEEDEEVMGEFRECLSDATGLDLRTASLEELSEVQLQNNLLLDCANPATVEVPSGS
jgi:hypothetical protein